jgi:hypothetical protein
VDAVAQKTWEHCQDFGFVSVLGEHLGDHLHEEEQSA